MDARAYLLILFTHKLAQPKNFEAVCNGMNLGLLSKTQRFIIASVSQFHCHLNDVLIISPFSRKVSKASIYYK